MTKYRVIYADPPWQYDNSATRGCAENHYRTMSIEALKSLQVESIAHDDCALFLWATYPKLHECLELIEAWGFRYRTLAFQWVKHYSKARTPFWGNGSWTRSNTEPCFLATRGKPRRVDMGVHQLIETFEADEVLGTAFKRHSEKPAEARDKIVRLMGDVPRVELFARSHAVGWDVWGNEVASTVELAA